MRRLIKEINKKLDKSLSDKERADILNFYEELINDRIEHGENINDIRASFNLNEVSSDINTLIPSKENPIYKSKSFNWLWLFAIPIVILILVIAFSLIIGVFGVIFGLSVAMISVILSSLIYVIEVLIESSSLPLILFVTGVAIIISTILILLLKPFFKLTGLITEYIIKWTKWSFTTFKRMLGGSL